MYDRGDRMNFPRIDNYFETEAQALEEIAARGWYGFAVDLDPEDELHWHDFDAVVFVLEGTASAEFADGSIEEGSVGAKIEAPAGMVHRTVGSSYRAALGLSVDPAELTQPVNKPVTE
jgi:quercetin dioxygenase-like cupin family protein